MDERAQLHNSIYRETNLWMFRKLFVFVCHALGLRFCAKNRHGPPTNGFFVVPYIYFDPKNEKMPSSSSLEQRKIFHIDW